MNKADIFLKSATENARLTIWSKKFAEIFYYLRGAVLQRASATEEGKLIFKTYKSGGEKNRFVLNLNQQNAGISLSADPIEGAPSFNALVQMIRKYFMGRKITDVYAGVDRVLIIIQFERRPVLTQDIAESDDPDCLILDLDEAPHRLAVVKRYESVPKRYDHVESHFQQGETFWESFCEWSLQYTRTKRRPFLDHPFVTYVPMFVVSESTPASQTSPSSQPMSPAPPPPPSIRATQIRMNVKEALQVLPSHLRRTAKTRLQFLERRYVRQKGDLPSAEDIEHLQKRAEGLRANLYLWPKGHTMWYVPRELIDEFGLPIFFKCRQGEKPGDLLDEMFHEVDRLQRRRQELLQRLSQTEQGLRTLETLLVDAAQELLGVEGTDPEHNTVKNLCEFLDVEWKPEAQKKREQREEKQRRLPYRSFQASTGELLRVGKSAAESDQMLKLMPSHHTWLHVAGAEGSHVWCERPKNKASSEAALREAMILAVHYSKFSRTKAADVQVAVRADVQRKKDLPSGKVILKKFKTIHVKYDDLELQPILARAL